MLSNWKKSSATTWEAPQVFCSICNRHDARNTDLKKDLIFVERDVIVYHI
jgi:hypothetical protein